MKKLGIAAALAAGVAMAGAPAAQAVAPPEIKPCSSIAATFETANIQMDIPEPVGSAAGPVVAAVCEVTG